MDTSAASYQPSSTLPPTYAYQSDQENILDEKKTPGRFYEFLFELVIGKEQSIYGTQLTVSN